MSDIRFLLEKAEQIVPGTDFNQAAYELRLRHPDSACYETVLSPEQTLETLAAGLIPKLRAHLACKPGLAESDLFVWLWFGDRAHRFRAHTLFLRLGPYEGGSPLLPSGD